MLLYAFLLLGLDFQPLKPLLRYAVCHRRQSENPRQPQAACLNDFAAFAFAMARRLKALS